MDSTLPPLRLLSVFAAVERHGGLRQAAAALNVSQPAVSQALRQLEDFLGTRLLDRRTRPARLTEAGRLLHQATVEGLGRIAEAVAEIRRLDTEDQRSLRIACSRSEEHTSELQSLMRISYAVFCLKKKKSNRHSKTHKHVQLSH